MIRKVRTKVKKIWASVALISVEIIVVTTVFAAAMFGFIYLVKRVFVLQNYRLDEHVFGVMQKYVNDRNNNIMMLITYLGTHYFLIPANLVLIIYFLFIKKHRWYSIKIPAIAISSLLLMFVLKGLFARPRPLPPLLNAAKGLSFPSGHALMSVTFYGLIAYMIWLTKETKSFKIMAISLLVLLVFMIGLSRVYLRVHYTTDVIAGFCMGFLWLVISIMLVRRIEQYSRKEVAPIVTD